MDGKGGERLERGSRWLDDHLHLDLLALLEAAEALRDEDQIAVLRATVKRMPELRTERSEAAWTEGSKLYELAVGLYSAKLPLEEQDIIGLLRTSKHVCGHGSDVAPPVDCAIAHARRHGLSRELGRAVRDYLRALKGTHSTSAQSVKRKAAFLLVTTEPLTPAERRAWASSIPRALDELPATEASTWRRAFLFMAVNDRAVAPARWRKECDRILGQLGTRRTLSFLEACWPPVGAETSLRVETTGSHVLKNFLWLLELLVSKATNEEVQRADALVRRLATMRPRPEARAEKVMLGVGRYLAERPSEARGSAYADLTAWLATLKRPGRAAEGVRDIVGR